MSLTKNPFETRFRGAATKPSEPKPDVTLTPSQRAAMPDLASAAAAPKKPPVTHSGGLPPTRKGGEADDKKSADRAAAGFQKANPFNRPQHGKVSHTDAEKKLQEQEDATRVWDPKKGPPPSGAPAPTVAVVGAPPSASVPVVATTAQGLEIVTPNSSSTDYDKQYAQKLYAAEMTLAEKAAQPVTAENYREVYLAQQQLAAERWQADQQQQMQDFIIDRQKKLDEAAANAHKARGLLAEMAQLQLKLVPDMDPAERHRVYGKLEELRIVLAQIPYYG